MMLHSRSRIEWLIHFGVQRNECRGMGMLSSFFMLVVGEPELPYIVTGYILMSVIPFAGNFIDATYCIIAGNANCICGPAEG